MSVVYYHYFPNIVRTLVSAAVRPTVVDAWFSCDNKNKPKASCCSAVGVSAFGFLEASHLMMY